MIKKLKQSKNKNKQVKERLIQDQNKDRIWLIEVNKQQYLYNLEYNNNAMV